MTMNTDVVILLSSGDGDGGAKATLAFSLGATFLTVGRRTSVFLALDGCVWASVCAPLHLARPGWKTVGDYMEAVTGLNGRIVHCAVCEAGFDADDRECASIRNGVTSGTLLDIVAAVQGGAEVISI